jgi:hypothetical protein
LQRRERQAGRGPVDFFSGGIYSDEKKKKDLAGEKRLCNFAAPYDSDAVCPGRGKKGKTFRLTF